MITLRSLIKKYNLITGLKLYYKFRYGKTKTLKIPSLAYPLKLTPNSIDNYSFYEIFIKEDYNLNYPNFKTDEINIIDAGANIGLASVFFANKFKNSKIISIEPDSDNFEMLKKNTSHYKNINIYNAALWNEKKYLNIIDKGWGTRGFMIEENKEKKENSVQSYSVLDLMKENKMKTISILKIDIEGSEKEVFESNFDKWIPKTKCIIVELHDRMRKGSSKSVYKSIGKFNFSEFTKGENVIFINNEL